METTAFDLVGTTLAVRRWGPPDGQPLLFLHSLGPAASGALLDLGMGPLAEGGWSVAGPDLPGFGRSPGIAAEAYDVPALADLVWQLADALGWDRPVLAGHSWGGAIAIHAAAARPERTRALLLVDSGHLDYADAPGADVGATLAQSISNAEAARIRAADRVDLAAQLEIAGDDPLVDALMEGMTDDGAGALIGRTTGASRGAAMYHLMRSRQTAQWPAIAAAGIPTLLLLATQPERMRALNARAGAELRAAIPQADVRPVEDATHSLITDLRERFGSIVAEWLRSIP